MRKLKITLKLNSPLISGSGEGLGSILDTEIVHDEYGLPVFPARRLKGLLRDSLQEVLEMGALLSTSFIPSLDVNLVFGRQGGKGDALVFMQNLYPCEYERAREWLKWAFVNHGKVINQDMVLNTFTEVRQQTAIKMKEGIAKNKSLRTSRVLKKGIILAGCIDVVDNREDAVKLLALACANLKHAGNNRTRGFGEVECCLWDNDINLTQEYLRQWKEVE